MTEVLAHFHRSGGTVHPHDVRTNCLDRRQRCSDLGTREHTSGHLHRHLELQWDMTSNPPHGPTTTDHRRLQSKEIELGLDQEEVDAAIEQAPRLLLVCVAQRGKPNLAERGHLRSGADRTGNPSGAVGG